MNRFLCEHKEIMNQKWEHEDTGYRFGTYFCSCGLQCPTPEGMASHVKLSNPNYKKNPADYFALLQLAIKKEWWRAFYFNSWPDDVTSDEYARLLLAPENLARLIAEYHGYKENK